MKQEYFRSSVWPGIKALWTAGKHESRYFALEKKAQINDSRGRPRGILVEATPTKPLPDRWGQLTKFPKFLVYYALPHQSAVFAEGMDKLEASGPASLFPGAAGVLHADAPQGGPWRIELVQGGFKVGATEDLQFKRVESYVHCKRHLLNEFFRQANENDVSHITLHVETAKLTTRAHFQRAAEQHGFSVDRTGRVATKK